MPKLSISIVIPVYNSEKILPNLIESIIFYLNKDFSGLKYEIILINDFSSDKSWEIITELSKKLENLKGINLSENCGQHNAIMAGLNIASGEKIITMDDDFQHHPSNLIFFFNKLDHCDACYTYYKNRKHNFWKKKCSQLNNLISSFLLDKPIHIYMSSFRGLNQKVLIEIIKYKEKNVYLDYLILKNANTVEMINVEHHVRLEGNSKYSLKKLLILWSSMVLCADVLPLRFKSFFILFFKLMAKLIVRNEKKNEQFKILGKTF